VRGTVDPGAESGALTDESVDPLPGVLEDESVEPPPDVLTDELVADAATGAVWPTTALPATSPAVAKAAPTDRFRAS
jgi:hypothetical protein